MTFLTGKVWEYIRFIEARFWIVYYGQNPKMTNCEKRKMVKGILMKEKDRFDDKRISIYFIECFIQVIIQNRDIEMATQNAF